MATKKKDRKTDPAVGKNGSAAGASKPASNQNKATAKSKNGKDNTPGPIAEGLQFLSAVKLEFSKITWPGRQQVMQETISVLFLVSIITLMVLAFDWLLGTAVFGPLEHWARIMGGGVGRG